MKSKIEFFEIPARDFDRAVRFYQSAFDLELKTYGNDTEKMAFFPTEKGQPRGAISFAPDFNPSGDGILITFDGGKDLGETLARVESAGGKIKRPKTQIEGEGMGYFATFLDSEGNQIGLHSEN